MSNDLAADWLLHGVAAAQAGDKAEARELLEHALIELDVMAEVYGVNDTDAREKAWYWLSRIADDPQQQRDYLENVLASNPTHPEARRELAILDGRLKPEEIVNPDRLNAAVAPPAAPRSDAVRRFVCPQCGGKLAFNPAKQVLACEYCGYQDSGPEAGSDQPEAARFAQWRADDYVLGEAARRSMPSAREDSHLAHGRASDSTSSSAGQDASSAHSDQGIGAGRRRAEDKESSALGQDVSSDRRRGAADSGSAAAEHDFASALYTARAHRWEIPTERILSCQSCGAHFTLPPSRVTGECPFCGSAHIVNANEGAELIEPGGVIPFQFDEQGAIRQLRQWLAAQQGSGLLHRRADDLRPSAGKQNLVKNSVKQAAFARPRPVYFPFWVFNIGGEVEWHGMVPQYRKDADALVWVPRSGSELAMSDNLLVAASHSLPAVVLGALGAPVSGGEGEPPAAAFELSALVSYAETYLADWPAEIYQISLADASIVARERVFADAKRRSSPGPEVQQLSYDSLSISIDTYKLILLPIWVSEFHFKDKLYPLVVNGQSGAVYGKPPQSGLRGRLASLLG